MLFRISAPGTVMPLACVETKPHTLQKYRTGYFLLCIPLIAILGPGHVSERLDM